MGNIGSSDNNVSNTRRRNSGRRSHPPPVTPQPEISANRFVYPASTPYTSQYQNSTPPPYFQYPNYYPGTPQNMRMPFPAPTGHHRRIGSHPHMDPSWMPVMPAPAPYVEHQKAVTIKNDVNVKRETIRIEPDEENPGKFLLAFTFDATVYGR